MTERLSIDLGTIELTSIDEYDFDSDLLTPADAFSFTIPVPGTYEQRRAFLADVRTQGLRLYAYMARSDSAGRALQMVGCIDKRSHTSQADGTKLRFSGTDNGGLLTRASADPRLGITEQTTLIEMVRAVCEPFGLEVITESAPSRTLMTGQRVSQERDDLLIDSARSYGIPASRMRADLLERRDREDYASLFRSHGGGTVTVLSDQAGPISLDSLDADIQQTVVRGRRGRASGMIGADVERLTLSEAKPSVGETCWEFIDRHCRRLGVMPWIDARGRLLISSPDYDQDPMWVLRRRLGANASESNILDGGVVEDYGALSSSCTVYGRAGGSDATRTPFHATVTNPRQPFYRPLSISDPTVRSEDEARRRAEREIGHQNEQAFVLEYEMPGHGQGPFLYAIDTVADVLDERTGTEGLFYVVSRRFTCSRATGPRTHLRLVPLGAIVL